MNRGERKERVVVVVSERSRLGASCLAQAYEQVIPIIRRPQTVGLGNGDAGPGAQQQAAGDTR